MQTLATINLNALAEAVVGSVAAGLSIVLAFSIGLRGLIRASELRADGRSLGAAMAAAIGTLGLLVAIAVTMIGLVIVAGDGPSG